MSRAVSERARLRREAREHRQHAQNLLQAIARLDRDDPESRDAARVWLDQAMHAERRADSCERWADRRES